MKVPQSLMKEEFNPSWHGEVHCKSKSANRKSQLSGEHCFPLFQRSQFSNLF
jgi:hypothetical protein